MQWWKAHPNLLQNSKRTEFSISLGLPPMSMQAVGHLFAWFSFVCISAGKDGRVDRFSPAMIAHFCEWPGDPDVFMDSLVKSGFIDKNPDGSMVAHDWMDVNGYAQREYERNKKARLDRKKIAEESQSSRTNETKRNETKEEPTLSPNEKKENKVSNNETINCETAVNLFKDWWKSQEFSGGHEYPVNDFDKRDLKALLQIPVTEKVFKEAMQVYGESRDPWVVKHNWSLSAFASMFPSWRKNGKPKSGVDAGRKETVGSRSEDRNVERKDDRTFDPGEIAQRTLNKELGRVSKRSHSH